MAQDQRQHALSDRANPNDDQPAIELRVYLAIDQSKSPATSLR